MSRQASRRNWATRLIAVGALTASMVACTDGGSDLPPPPSPEPTRPAPPTAVDPAHQPILDAYYGAIEAMVAASRTGDPHHPALTTYYIERTPALNHVQNTITRHDSRGAYYAGDLVVIAAEVTEVAMDDVPATATISACLDDTSYQLRFREDDSPVPGAQPGGRYSVTATALHGTDGNWYIVESDSHWDEPC